MKIKQKTKWKRFERLKTKEKCLRSKFIIQYNGGRNKKAKNKFEKSKNRKLK